MKGREGHVHLVLVFPIHWSGLEDSLFGMALNVWLKMLKHSFAKTKSFTFRTMSDELSFSLKATHGSTFELNRTNDSSRVVQHGWAKEYLDDCNLWGEN